MKELSKAFFEIITAVRQARIEIGLHELEPEGRNKVIDEMLHRSIIKTKELEAALSPRLIEEAPEEWFDGRSVLVWDDEYERTFIGMFVSPLGWVVDERGLDSLTQLHCVTKVLPLPSMDGGEK